MVYYLSIFCLSSFFTIFNVFPFCSHAWRSWGTCCVQQRHLGHLRRQIGCASQSFVVWDLWLRSFVAASKFLSVILWGCLLEVGPDRGSWLLAARNTLEAFKGLGRRDADEEVPLCTWRDDSVVHGRAERRGVIDFQYIWWGWAPEGCNVWICL